MEVSPYHYKRKDSFETLFKAASDNMTLPGDRGERFTILSPQGPRPRHHCGTLMSPYCKTSVVPLQHSKCQIVGAWLVKVILHCRQLHTSLNLKKKHFAFHFFFITAYLWCLNDIWHCTKIPPAWLCSPPSTNPGRLWRTRNPTPRAGAAAGCDIHVALDHVNVRYNPVQILLVSLAL